MRPSDNLFWFSAILQQIVAVARSQMKSENGNVGISYSLHDFLLCFSLVFFSSFMLQFSNQAFEIFIKYPLMCSSSLALSLFINVV